MDELYWKPTRNFDLQLKIGDLDLTQDLIEFTIITSIDLPYQSFVLKLLLDPNDVILQKIYGQKTLKLSVILLATEQYPLERTEFELMYLQSDMDMVMQVAESTTRQKDRMPITISAVASKAYKTMTTFVNDIYSGTTIENAISDLVTNTGATIKYDSHDKNTTIIDQILVPPSTLYNNLKYINYTFGIFNGIPGIYCSYDNVVYIKNLTNKMKQAQAFTVYQIALDNENTEELIKKCNDGKHYYTLTEIATKYEGNSVFAFLAPSLTYVVKPKDRLFQNIDIDLETFTKTYGLISKNDEIFFNKSAIDQNARKTVHKDHTGYEVTQSFINGNESKNIRDITDVSLSVVQDIKILNLMKVGESVELTSEIISTETISGRYLLKTSEINFVKHRDWDCAAILNLIRSNRTIT